MHITWKTKYREQRGEVFNNNRCTHICAGKGNRKMRIFIHYCQEIDILGQRFERTFEIEANPFSWLSGLNQISFIQSKEIRLQLYTGRAELSDSFHSIH